MATELTLDQGLAGRYATAVFELAQEEKSVEAVEGDLLALKAMIGESADLARLVRAPVFSSDQQSAGMNALLQQMNAVALTRNFIATLIRRRRLFTLPAVIAVFEVLVARQRGEISAEITSARPLNADEIGQVKDALRAQIGRDPRIQAKVDPSILGGLIVKVGSRMIDSSLRSKLNGMRAAMRG